MVVMVVPEPDVLLVTGDFTVPFLSDRSLMRPGTKEVVAEKEGYMRLQETFEVTRARDQVFEFSLVKQGGLLRLSVTPREAVVEIDGTKVGVAGQDIALAAGPHEIRVSADRYLPHLEEIEIEGLGRTHELTLALKPRWASISLISEPPDAAVVVDGVPVGNTPTVAEILDGAPPGHISQDRVQDRAPADRGPGRRGPGDGRGRSNAR